MPFHYIFKKIAKACLNNRECSAQETVYHVFPELKLKRIFANFHFVNTNLPEERVQVPFSEKELREV